MQSAATGASKLYLRRWPLTDSDDLDPIGVLPSKRANFHYVPVISKNRFPLYIF
jgi:hypothetical protein